MRRVAVIVAVLAVVGGIAASFSLAVSVRDRDDVTTALDVAKVAGAHNRVSDQLVQTVDFYEAAAPATLVTKGRPPSSVCVEIWTRSTPGEASPDYEACATPVPKRKTWVGSITRKRRLGPRLRVASVKVEQPTATRLVMRIDPDDIKRPASYRWRVESTDFGSDCKHSTGCPDYAPDRPDTVETKLGKPRR